MKLTEQEAAARLAAAPEMDLCVLRIEDGDYGCEERREPPQVWLLALDRSGRIISFDLPEPVLSGLGLEIGSLLRRTDLPPSNRTV